MATILLTHPPEVRENYYSDRALSGLAALGEVRRNPLDRELSTVELIDAARGCGIIVTHRHVPGEAQLFASLPDLAAFCRCAMDIRNVDVGAASSHGVLVTHASAGFVAATAEWVLGAMIDLGRDISLSTVDYRNGKVRDARMGRQLKGSTLGVIGYGQIGRYLCEIATVLGMRVLVNDPYVTVANAALTQVELPHLLAQSDFVACMAVATDETENLMNERAFASMKPGAYFVNASRGNLVDEAALLRALDSGYLAGCALDVGRDHDQQPSLALARHPKIIATPHIGGLTPPATEHQALETVAQVAEILQGRAPKGAANADQAARLSRFRKV